MASATIPDTVRDLECPICHETFHTPKMLPCGHSMCLDPCLLQVARDKSSVSCPECRTLHSIPGGDVANFPTNISLVRLLSGAGEKTSGSKESTNSSCPVCDEEHEIDTLIKCLHCGILLCEDCRIEHTVFMRDETNAALTALKAQLAEYDVTDLHTLAISRDDENIKGFDEAIDKVINEGVEALKARGKQLKDKIRCHVKNGHDTVLEGNVTEMKKKLSEVQEFCKSLGKPPGAQKKLLKYQQQIKQHKLLIDECKARMMNSGDIELNLANDDMLRAVNQFGKIQKPSEVPGIDMKQDTEDQKSVDVRPKKFAGNSGVQVKPPAAPKPLPPPLKDRDINKVVRCIGRTGKEPGMFENPSDVAVSPVTGNIIVVDQGNRRLQIFTESGDFIRVIKFPIGFHAPKEWPMRLKMMSNGNVCLLTCTSEGSTVCLCIVTEEGKYTWSFVIVTSLFFAEDSEKRIHVTNGKDGVYLYDKFGALITRYGQVRGVDIDGKHIVINPQTGEKYIFSCRDIPKSGFTNAHVEYVVHKFNKDLQYVDSTVIDMKGAPGKGYSISSVSVVEDGMFLITWNHVMRYSIQSSVVLLDQQFKHVRDIVPRSSLGKGVGKVHEPTGAALTQNGHVAVVDGNDFLQLF